MVETTSTTPISRQLHHEALAWFHQHPGQQEFFRAYVSGEFTAAQEKQIWKDLGGYTPYVHVSLVKLPLCTRVPLTQDAYEQWPRRPAFYTRPDYTDRPILQNWFLPFKEKLVCDMCKKSSATWEARIFEDALFGAMLFQAKVKHEHINETLWTNTVLEQVIRGPQLHETQYYCQRCMIESTNRVPGNLKATQVIPVVQKHSEWP